MPNRVGDVDDGVALGSGDLLLHSGSGVLLFFLLSLFSLGLGGLWLATEVAAGDGTSSRALGRGSYSQAGIGEPGDRRLGIQGRSGRELASNGVRGVAWAWRKGEIGPCPGHDPWPTLPLLSGLCRAVV